MVTKCDLEGDAPKCSDNFKAAEAIAKEWGCAIFKTSSKTGSNINESFQYLIDKAVEKADSNPSLNTLRGSSSSPNVITLDKKDEHTTSGGKCKC
jgi:hypothetical protein